MYRITILVLAVGLLAGGALAQTDDLIISEYVEGSGSNKALEIYNGTEDFISLGSYTIERYSNGSTDAFSIALTAVDLGPGDTWVIANPSSIQALLDRADQTDSNLNFNGNDALVLRFAGTQVVDSFGRVGEDPGSYWSCAEGTTANHTMRRLSSICNGDKTIGDAFDPCEEWSFFASDVFTGLGTHIADCGAVGNSNPAWGSLKASFR